MTVRAERPAFLSPQLRKEYERDNEARGIGAGALERLGLAVARMAYGFEATEAERQEALVDQGLLRFDANADRVIDGGEKRAFDEARVRYERLQQSEWEKGFARSTGWAAFTGAWDYATDGLTIGYEKAMLKRGARYDDFAHFLDGEPGR
jgi:hypothetical protein